MVHHLKAPSPELHVFEEKRRKAFAHLLKARRTDRGLSINELARLAGVAKSNLARMEAGDGNPSLETLWALSVALGVNVRELIDPEPSGVRLLRAGQTFDAQADTANFGVKLLSTCPAGVTRDLYLAIFQPGVPKLSGPHSVSTVEHIILIRGRAKVGPIDAPEVLFPGDYLTFSGGQQHIYEALELDTTALIIMEGS